jgi:hypothetical protein
VEQQVEAERSVGCVVVRGEVVREPEIRVLPSGDEVGELLVRVRDVVVGTSSLALHCPRPGVVAGIGAGDHVVAVARPHRRFRRVGQGVSSRVDLVVADVARIGDRRGVARVRRLADGALDAAWAPPPRRSRR